MVRHLFPIIAFGLIGCADPALNPSPTAGAIPNRTKLPGILQLKLRQRPDGKLQEKIVEWKVAETAVIICDMWDDHYCKAAAQRVGVMVPRMNAVLTAARDHGVQIIHSPSGTLDLYADMVYRKRVQYAKPAKPPFALNAWCYRDPDREPELPVDTTKSACEDPIPGLVIRKFTRQHPGLDILGYDGISDSGSEIYNFFQQEGIKNVAIMGVHTNMCVLGRPFGIRQLVKLNMQVALVRDLTDTMYDPRQPPYVSHTRGTELVIEHIEQHWCGSIVGEDLCHVKPGSAGP